MTIKILKSNRARWAGHVRCMVVIEIRTEFWQENLKSPLGIPGHRQEDNIKMGPKIGCEAVGQIHQAQGMDQWRGLGNGYKPSYFTKFWEFLDRETLSFSIKNLKFSLN